MARSALTLAAGRRRPAAGRWRRRRRSGRSIISRARRANFDIRPAERAACIMNAGWLAGPLSLRANKSHSFPTAFSPPAISAAQGRRPANIRRLKIGLDDSFNKFRAAAMRKFSHQKAPRGAARCGPARPGPARLAAPLEARRQVRFATSAAVARQRARCSPRDNANCPAGATLSLARCGPAARERLAYCEARRHWPTGRPLAGAGPAKAPAEKWPRLHNLLQIIWLIIIPVGHTAARKFSRPWKSPRARDHEPPARNDTGTSRGWARCEAADRAGGSN